MFANVYMSIGGGVHIVCPGICGTYNVYTYAWHAYAREHLSGCSSPAGAKRPLQRLFPSSLWLPEHAGGGGGQAGPDPCAAAASTPPPHPTLMASLRPVMNEVSEQETGLGQIPPSPHPHPSQTLCPPLPHPSQTLCLRLPPPAWLDPQPVSCYGSWALRCSHQILSSLPT